MVKKLGVKDKDIILNFIKQDGAMNRIIRDNIEDTRFNKEYMEAWGSFNHEKKLDGLLVRFYDHYIAYYKSGFTENEKFKYIIRQNDIKLTLEGMEKSIEGFKDIFPAYIKKKTYFAELKSSEGLLDIDKIVKVADGKDSQRICDFLNKIEEFNNGVEEKEAEISKRIREKKGRVYYIENDDGIIISQVQTTTEIENSALIISVATLKEYRGCGLASKCLSMLCRDLINEGKSPCLYYATEEAARLYEKLGFKTLGLWSLIIKL